MIILLKVPTLIVQGVNDKRIGAASLRDLSNLANQHTEILTDAGHACYMNQTDKWNRLIYNFISMI